VVPADEREALRQLQEAAAQHALDAFHAVEGGGNGEKDQEFNRNARTAAHLARIRQALVGPADAKGEGEKTQVVMIENHRDDGAPADSAPADNAPAAPEPSASDRDDDVKKENPLTPTLSHKGRGSQAEVHVPSPLAGEGQDEG
jgi:hypothetical protein